jgi:UDP-GlcNAc:undecaprenyl-phosphate GlcNAc-1-phosphate transferase
LLFSVSVHQTAESVLAADIAFRFAQRLSLASAERLERLFSESAETGSVSEAEAETDRGSLRGSTIESAAVVRSASRELVPSPSARSPLGGIRGILGWTSSPVSPARSLGEE